MIPTDILLDDTETHEQEPHHVRLDMGAVRGLIAERLMGWQSEGNCWVVPSMEGAPSPRRLKVHWAPDARPEQAYQVLLASVWAGWSYTLTPGRATFTYTLPDGQPLEATVESSTLSGAIALAAFRMLQMIQDWEREHVEVRGSRSVHG